MISLGDAILAYLSQNSIGFEPKDYEASQANGEAEKITVWNESKLGPQPMQEQLDAAWSAKEAADAAGMACILVEPA